MEILKKINFYLFPVLYIGLILGEFARVQLGDGVALTIQDIGVFLISVFWTVRNFRTNLFSYQLCKPLAIFICMCILSLLINIFSLNLSSFLVSFAYLLRFALYAMIFFVVNSTVKKQKKYLFFGIVISSFIIVLIGFLQYRFYESLQNLYYLGWDKHLYRLFSTFFDPNFAGAFAVLVSVLSAELAISTFKKQNKWLMLFYLYLLGSSIIALFLTYSRSALLMFVVSWLVLFILHKKTKWILAIFLLLLLYTGIVSQKFSIEGFNLLRTVSSEARLDSAKTAIIVFTKKPVFGVGFNSYRYALVSYRLRNPINALATTSHADAGTDNSYLFVLATTGIVGFGAYCYLLYALYRYAFTFIKKGSVFSYISIASLAGLMVDSLFINSLFFPAFMLWLWIIFGFMDYM